MQAINRLPSYFLNVLKCRENVLNDRYFVLNGILAALNSFHSIYEIAASSFCYLFFMQGAKKILHQMVQDRHMIYDLF